MQYAHKSEHIATDIMIAIFIAIARFSSILYPYAKVL